MRRKQEINNQFKAAETLKEEKDKITVDMKAKETTIASLGEQVTNLTAEVAKITEASNKQAKESQ